MHSPREPLIFVVVIAIVLPPLVACASAARDESSARLEVMSFNLRWGPDRAPNDWETRKELVAATVRREAPDVVGLQECRDSFVKDLVSALPEYAVYPEDGDRTNSILYRVDRLRLDRQVSDAENARVDTPDRSWGPGSVRLPRAARFVEKESGRGFYVYNNHMDHRFAESRVWSALVLIDRIRGRTIHDPVILTGDFNAVETAPEMRFIRGETPLEGDEGTVSNTVPFLDTWDHLHPDVKMSGTFHRFLGLRFGSRIDYVLVEPSLRVLDARILRDEWNGRFPSDHFPVSATLVLP